MDSVNSLHVDRGSEVYNLLEETTENNRDENSSFLFGEMESSRAEKRTRVVDEEEVWVEVGRRGKVMVRSTSADDSARIPKDEVEISMTSKNEKLPKQIGLARMLKQENILDIIEVKYINAYKVMLKFSNSESAEKLMQCRFFIDKEYRCQKTYEVGVSYGVIRNIDIGINDSDILEDLESSVQIINVKRLKRRNYDNGGFEDSECVRICFKGSSLPPFIYTFGTRIKVDPFVFPVTQCSKCWRFGHNYKECSRNKIICPKCGQFHNNCETTKFRCVNCKGQHMALAKICPYYKKERKIRELMAEYNCTYKRALTIYVQPSPQYEVRQEEYIHDNVFGRTHSDTGTTYAEVLKTTTEAYKTKDVNINSTKSTAKKARNTSKENKGRIQSDEDSSVEFDSDMDLEMPVCDENYGQEREKFSKFDVQQLLKKIKDIIFMRKINFLKKLKLCGRVIYNWLMDSIVEYITQWSNFKNLFQNG